MDGNVLVVVKPHFFQIRLFCTPRNPMIEGFKRKFWGYTQWSSAQEDSIPLSKC